MVQNTQDSFSTCLEYVEYVFKSNTNEVSKTQRIFASTPQSKKPRGHSKSVNRQEESYLAVSR